MEANKRYDMFKFLLKVLSGLIIQTKLALDCSQSPIFSFRLDIPRLIAQADHPLLVGPTLLIEI